ncbi:imelysin family protein [Pedobacter arcticus]|uniref:imelysin family protein n=1 Tax=Pedobacter arcticus TaxID=752140 RepID=UPI0002E8096B|nr:imelysin family protein [Pedobacter arcticus]
MIKVKSKFVAIFWMMLILVACSKSPKNNNENLFGTYDQAVMLENIANQILLSDITSFQGNTKENLVIVENFTGNPTFATLKAAQDYFKILSQNWAKVAPFNFGPMQTELIAANIDTWPAKPVKMETAVANQIGATGVGADTKGLKGLEYLLFDKNGDAEVLVKYTTATDAVARKAFLNSVSTELVAQATNLNNAWTKGYFTSFINAKGNDVSSSLSQTVNGIALYLDEIKNMKVANPIGIGVKVNDNKSHPDIIEYTLAEQSLEVMRANVLVMKSVFNGGSGQGIDDLLDYVKAQKDGKNLSVVVGAQFDEVIAKIDAVNSPYASAVNNNKQQVQDVFNSLKTLIAYLKVDVANNLGVTITFSDTDGD